MMSFIKSHVTQVSDILQGTLNTSQPFGTWHISLIEIYFDAMNSVSMPHLSATQGQNRRRRWPCDLGSKEMLKALSVASGLAISLLMKAISLPS